MERVKKRKRENRKHTEQKKERQAVCKSQLEMKRSIGWLREEN